MMLSLKPALSGVDVKRIYEHSLDVVHTVGIDFKTPAALKILESRGCQVDYDRTWASIPPDWSYAEPS